MSTHHDLADIRETLHSIDSAGGTNAAQNLAILNLLRELRDREQGDIPKRATPGDYGTPECPRTPNGGTPNAEPGANARDANTPRTRSIGADVPQEAAIPPSSDARRSDPGTCEGRAGNGPQNAIQSAAMGEVVEDPDDYEPYDVFQPALNRARHATDAEIAFPTGPDGSLWWITGESECWPVEGLAQMERAGHLTLLDGSNGLWIDQADDRLDIAERLVAVPLALLDRLYESTAYHDGAALAAIHQIEQWAVEHGQTGE